MPGAWRGGTSVDERAAWTGAGSSLGLLPLTTEALISTAPLLCPGASRPNVSRRNVGAAWPMLGQVGAWQLGRRGWRCPGSSSPNSAGSRTPRARAARHLGVATPRCSGLALLGVAASTGAALAGGGLPSKVTDAVPAEHELEGGWWHWGPPSRLHALAPFPGCPAVTASSTLRRKSSSSSPAS